MGSIDHANFIIFEMYLILVNTFMPWSDAAVFKLAVGLMLVITTDTIQRSACMSTSIVCLRTSGSWRSHWVRPPPQKLPEVSFDHQTKKTIVKSTFTTHLPLLLNTIFTT